MFLVPLKTNLPPTTRIAPPFSQLYSHDFRIETIRYPRRISLLIEALDQCSPRSSLETLLFRKELSRWSILFRKISSGRELGRKWSPERIELLRGFVSREPFFYGDQKISPFKQTRRDFPERAQKGESMIGNRSGRSPREEEATPTLPLLLWSVAPSLSELIAPSQMGKTSFATE